MCLVGDVLYLAGGIESDEGDVDSLPWPASARLQALDLKTLEWTLCPEMPEPRVEALSVAVDGKLYVLGGFPVFWPHNYAVVNEAGSMDSLRSVYSFDPRTAAWSAEPDLPPFRRSGIHWRGGEGMNAVAHAGKVCVFGLAETPPLALARGVCVDGAPTNTPAVGSGASIHLGATLREEVRTMDSWDGDPDDPGGQI